MHMSRRLGTAILAFGLLVGSVVPVMAQGGPTVGLVQHATLGTIMTDSSGITLYIWEGDTPGVSNCSDACAGAWPPAVVDEAGMMMMMPGMGMDMAMTSSGLGAIQRADGSWQLSWNGWPLYRFQRDVAPGEANGQGSMGFGARWSVVSITPM
jgi:predicted lipoprotein with Yx(FWY)xxD motif